METLPLVLLSIRMQASVAKLLYGTTPRLRGEFCLEGLGAGGQRSHILSSTSERCYASAKSYPSLFSPTTGTFPYVPTCSSAMAKFAALCKQSTTVAIEFSSKRINSSLWTSAVAMIWSHSTASSQSIWRPLQRAQSTAPLTHLIILHSSPTPSAPAEPIYQGHSPQQMGTFSRMTHVMSFVR